jgi:hypothetical protein
MSKSDSEEATGKARTALAGPMKGMLDQLVESGEAERMQGLDIERLKAAMSAPGAAETVAAIQAMGANAQASAGMEAPDFELRFLPGSPRPGDGVAKGETIRLSDRFANRPVALVFGSYT